MIFTVNRRLDIVIGPEFAAKRAKIIHQIAVLDVDPEDRFFAWMVVPCQVQLGCTNRSPGSMNIGSPWEVV